MIDTMKKLTFYFLLALSSIISMSFLTDPINMTELLNTKWISPINDNCFESLCFNSERTVMYYRCEWNTYVELGFKINGDKVEIETYSKESLDPDRKMVLLMDNGVLRQPMHQNNRFPKNFILVPGSACN